jgi:membrane protein DedA with SNARE-associated domain
MTQHLTQTLVSLVASYGLIAVFVLMAAESCGLPFPSEVIMPVGGALVAAGHLPFPGVVLAGAVGNLVGSLAAYGLAARFGAPLLLGPGRWVGFSRSHLEMAQRWFGRYGLLAVFLGRMLPVVRTYISFPAGLAQVRLGPFSLLTLVGALPWCAALTAVGYILGANYERVSGPMEKIATGIAVVVLIIVVAWFVRGRTRPASERPA